MLSLYMVGQMTFLFAQIVTHYTDPMTLGGFFHLAVNFLLYVGKHILNRRKIGFSYSFESGG